MNKVKCEYCDKEFSVMGINTHMMRSHLNIGFKGSSGRNKSYSNPSYKQKLSTSVKESANRKNGHYKNFDVNCHKCGCSFEVLERESNFPSKDHYFCSRSCANSRVISAQTREKIARSLQKESLVIEKQCEYCDKEYRSSNKTQKFCSVSCARKFRYKDIDKQTLSYYRKQCSFDFNLKDYPNEFDFSLIEQYGWYKPKNRGDNLNGISRDHIISVRYGFDNHIDPNIISHPANCQLLRHNDNVSKYTKCHMTIDDLLAKIEQWDNKYRTSSAEPIREDCNVRT